MTEYSRYAAATASAGLGFLIVALLLVLSGCDGDDDSNPAPPPDEVIDYCPVDPLKTEEGLCGCGIADMDSDGDGDPDCTDVCPDLPDALVCGSETEVVVAGEASVMELDGARLTIPADTLDTGMRVIFSRVDPASLSTPPNGSGEFLMTPVYAIEFSAAQIVNGELLLALDVPDSLVTGFYARVKAEGGLGTEGQTDSPWIGDAGTYDGEQSLLTIELSATATRILVTGITTSPVVPGSFTTSSLTPDFGNSELKVRRTPFGATVKAAAVPGIKGTEFAAHGWVVLCDPAASGSADSQVRCNPQAIDFDPYPGLNDLGAKIYEADKRLAELGFRYGRIKRYSPQKLERKGWPYAIYDVDNRSQTTATETGDASALKYNVAFMDSNFADTIRGVYFPNNKALWVDAFESSDVMIHEMMHSVQAAEIPNTFSPFRLWILEGLAAATEYFAPSSPFTNPLAYRFNFNGDGNGDGTWRNWGIPLSSEEGLARYEVLEFWLNLDSTFSRFPDFYTQIRSKPRLTENNDYDLVDEALLETGLPSLRDGYRNLILARSQDAGYPAGYCTPVGLDCINSGDEGCVYPTDSEAVSALCLDTTVVFDDECPDEPQDVQVTLENLDNPNIQMLLDGTLHEANTPIPFSGNGKIWVINTSYPDGSSAGSTSSNLIFEDKAECNPYVQLERQKIFAGAAANAAAGGGNALYPGTDGSGDIYTSYEDLILDSFITSYERLRKPDQYIDTVVAPLGLNAWSASPSVSTVHSCDDVMFPGCTNTTVSTATASATVTTETENDATSMTTVGSHALSATIGNKAPYATAQGTNEYTYILAGESVELTLTWGCDMSNVLIKFVDPDTRAPETLYQVGNYNDDNDDGNINNWECGSKVWVLPTDRLVYIRLASQFNEYLSDAGSPETYKNNGGAFEIKFEAILPEEGN